MSGFYQTRVNPGWRRHGTHGGKRIPPSGTGAPRKAVVGVAIVLFALAALVVVAISVTVLRVCTKYKPDPAPERSESARNR